MAKALFYIICHFWLFLSYSHARSSSRRHSTLARVDTNKLSLSSSPSTTTRHQFNRSLNIRGGGPGNSAESGSVKGSSGGGEDEGINGAIKKVVIVLGAFAVQQTLTKLADSRGFSLTSKKSSAVAPPPPPPPMVKGKSKSKNSLALLESPKKSDDGVSSGGATIPQHVFNMVKGIVGVGVLSLPAGIAAFGNAPSAILPAVVIITVIGILSAIGFSWTGQVCAVLAQDKEANCPTPSYRQAWSYSISEKSSWIPSISVTSMTFLACLCFSMVLTDSVTELVKPLVKGASRTSVLWSITAIILLPLCWMKDLKSLAPFSLLGVAGMLYTGLAMASRYFSGSYSTGSALLEKVPLALQPSFGNDGWKAVFKPGSITLVSMLSTAYMCHFNAPKFYNELKDNTIPRFNTVVAAGFGISILMTAAIACIGFATFGANSNGFVLNNYAPTDLAMGLSRVAVAISLTFSYPLCFQGLREGALDVLQIPPSKRKDSHLNVATVALLVCLTLLATILKDVGVVLALTGATLGNLLCYIFPAIMYGRVNPTAKLPTFLVAVMGFVLGGIGVKLAVEAM
mmetsp:Transcript_2050/g.2862  ORF Transcript_2050/g.2862 Transcript_2050/m.2862 type:complete len:570 (-) Transcript_2050:286-1995(-)|eukprot:CAMPEP_0198146526 /NCGR_PEP_ID=MMETSP1443-20131203/29701_1 /TAXON_ID=186043 /ORGANISM="Entomoneis sp., Strain CCMP2396" /LENGTH=569 /DNA_ID=CAMNT_0043810515 /DNA_START=85 /DNA_END=1794 /DNA_ORIENTATION=+